MLRFLSLTVLLVFCLQTFSQSLDSLEQQLQNPLLDTHKKIDVLNILSREYTFIDTHKSLKYAQKALDKASDENYLIGKAYAYRNFSNIYTANEVYFLGMDYIQKSNELFHQLNDSAGIADNYISLGHFYRNLGNVRQEIKYNKKALEAFEQLNLPARIGVASHNLGESYFNQHNLQKSRHLTIKSIALNKATNQRRLLSACYKVMGKIELAEDNLNQAQAYFDSALFISAQLKRYAQKRATAESFFALAKIEKKRNNFSQQKRYLEKAINYCSENGYTSLLPEIYLEMVQMYVTQNNKQQTQRTLQAYKHTVDSIKNQSVTDKMNLVNNLVKVYNLEKDKHLLLQAKQIQQQNISRKNMLLLLTLLLIATLVFMFFRIKKINKKIKTAIERLRAQNKLIVSQKQDLENLNATKDKLFSIIAHDLRSPFNSIIGFTDLYIKFHERYTPNKKLDLVKMTHQSANSTLQLLEQLLTWARNQTGQIAFQPKQHHLNHIVEQVLPPLQTYAQLKSIQIHYSSPADFLVCVDFNMILTIFRNLVQNAIKFTQHHGTIKIIIHELPDKIKVSVSDNGVGMSNEVQENLFSINKQKSASGTANEKGSGLGLILCKNFVEKHGSTLTVQSRLSIGTCFSFELPKAGQ